ncbi:hypothetical protein AYI68_g444, partial [Smittium mucronatum]
MGQRP